MALATVLRRALTLSVATRAAATPATPSTATAAPVMVQFAGKITFFSVDHFSLSLFLKISMSAALLLQTCASRIVSTSRDLIPAAVMPASL